MASLAAMAFRSRRAYLGDDDDRLALSQDAGP